MNIKFLSFRRVVFALFFLAYLSPAQGDEYHAVNTLIGERASSLGGAYIGISDDPSGMYYNPAGMVFGFENYISVSANTYSSSDTRFKDIVPGRDYSIRSSGFIPSFLGFSQSLGKSKIAFAVVMPNSQLLNQDDVLTDLNSSNNSVNSLRRRYFSSDNTYLFGPGFSSALGEHASIGFSLLGSIRTSVMIDSQFMQFNPVGTGKYFTQESQIQYNHYGYTPKLGFQFMPLPTVVLGAVLSKSFHLSGTGKSRVIRSKVDAAGMPVTPTGSFDSDFEIREKNILVIPPLPWVMGVGGAFYPTKRFLVALDGTYHVGDSGATSVVTQDTYNVSLGSEWYAWDWLVLRFGLYTDNAVTPQVVQGKVNQLPHVNLVGGTFGLSVIKTGSSFGLGVQYAKGSGKGQAIGQTTDIQDVSQQLFSIHLSGSYQL